MALLTTTIGAFPKPDYVPTPDWFRDGGAGISNPTEAYQNYLADLPEDIEERLDRGTREAVIDQVVAGIDIPTDGEIRRENYIHYHCRHCQFAPGNQGGDRQSSTGCAGAYRCRTVDCGPGLRAGFSHQETGPSQVDQYGCRRKIRGRVKCASSA